MDNASIAIINGTKAQLIKMAPVLIELDRRGIAYELIYTGQHFETISDLESVFGVRSADDVMIPNFEAATKKSFLLWSLSFWRAAFRRIISGKWRQYKIALVHGDTASTLYATIAMRIAGVKVAHVEAGLRSSDVLDPFPEEIIRRLVSRFVSIHFAPDEKAKKNLSKVSGEIVMTHGNTMRDCLRLAIENMGGKKDSFNKSYAIFSVHRNENLSNNETFDFLMKLLVEISKVIDVKFVLHPATREKIISARWLNKIQRENGIEMLNRMDYFAFVKLMLGSKFICTDGGSNQEEAAMLGLPTLILRKNTERQDGLDDTAVLSRLENKIINDFILKHINYDWDIKEINKAMPSYIIVERLARI